MAAAAPPQHHHQSTTKASHKSFKSRHASKGALKERAKGKVESLERGSRRTPHQQVMSKIDRRNHAKQIRMNKMADRREEKGVFEGRDGAPRVVAIVPLCADVEPAAVLAQLNGSVDLQLEPQSGPWRVEIARFKQRVQYLTPARNLFACLDACRLADYVIFVLSATEEVDEMGEQLVRCIESQGVSTVLTGIHNLTAIEPAKRRPDVVKSLRSYINHFFPAQEKVHDLSNRQECSNVMRSLCATTPKGIKWREDRSWMVVEDVRWDGHAPVVTGVVRGRSLKANRLVQVGEWGDFQVDKITAAPSGERRKGGKGDAMAVDVPDDGDILEQADDERDDLDELAPEETMMDDVPTASMAPSERRGVLLDDHHYFDDEDEVATSAPKRLPRGTSKYQAAWYLGDVSDSGSDLESVSGDEDMSMDGLPSAGPADGHFDLMPEPTEAGAPSEYPQSEVFDDRAPEDETQEIEAYRSQRRGEAEEDLEFPDEIELLPNVSARERLARYRGLKSLRTSAWDTEEDKPHEPEDWRRLLEIADYKSAKNRVLKDTLVGGVKPGSRVHVHLRISPEQAAELRALATPTALYGLLRHEHKRAAINCSISLSSDHPEPVRSKEQLYMQCGPRRLAINPLFSQAGNTPNNVHKFDRFLHPGQTTVASFIGPVTWGSVPCLFFKQRTASSSDAVEELAHALSSRGAADGGMELVGTGTLLPPSTSRVIAKRVILTGHPYKMHKKLVTVRYMFFNDDDVQYFKALQLWTRRGRSGFIKETLGTHGYFKATFDGRINPMDAVAVSLYKRVWPRQAALWRPGFEDVPALGESEHQGDAMTM